MVGQFQAVSAARATSHAGTSALVRPPWSDPVLIKRYLDIGAQNLLIPFVQTAEEAAAAVAACRFAPTGTSNGWLGACIWGWPRCRICSAGARRHSAVCLSGDR
ncbi:aldolase/citrate lyase family protein [Pseudomonas asiatica]|uniref:aldolase/citrate lyase family protein n=1 Tax=Pseudomonas asiatica TaxID=2219225 RepID=UPI003878420D